MAKVTGSHLIVKSLQAEGVDTVFGIAGDHFLHLLNVMVDHPFRMIDTRHEAGAVHMADAYSRLLRKAGVALSTTPGHANAVAGLANAVHSEAPVVNIAGSAETPNLGRGAMQEFDQVGIAAAVTKGAWQVPSAERIPEYIAHAFRIATTGRRGPVHLTIPHDLQSAEVDESAFDRFAPREYSEPRSVLGDPKQVEHALDLLNGAQRPLIIAGPGAGASCEPAEIKRFIEITRIPFLSEDSARSLLPDNHEYSMGFGYLPLNKAARKAFAEADVVLLLGRRLDYMAGFGGTPPFAKGVKHIMVSASAADIGRSRTVEVGILGDSGPVVTQLADAAMKKKWAERTNWVTSLRQTRDAFQEELAELAVEKDPMHPMFVSQALSKFIDDDTVMVFDGGDYCHFFRASLKANKPYSWLYVSSFGMIGVGVPYALGAQAAFPKRRVVLVTGDGSFGFNGMEIDTAVRHNLPVVMVLGNNGIWGIDWQIQKGLYGRPVWTDLLPTRYDIVAKGLGAHSENVEKASELAPALKRAFDAKRVALVNVTIDKVISPVAEAAISRKLGTHG
ncbi:MAG: thiamine pyrophosphate-binding protein [Dehalococcoidia bacterium]|nr:thiamine pyrophosphate-binding protein [Dehalococcoidia bacterium]